MQILPLAVSLMSTGAHAADGPTYERGVHLSVAVAYTASPDPASYPGLSATGKGGIGIHLGRRLLVELEGGGASATDVASSEERDTKSGSLVDASGESVGGPSYVVGAGLWVSVAQGAATNLYIGLRGSYGAYASEGTVDEWVETEGGDDGEGATATVGSVTEVGHEASGAIGVECLHWLAPRVALTAGLAVDVFRTDSTLETTVYDEGTGYYKEGTTVTSSRDVSGFGAWPTASVGVRFLLF